MEPYAKRQRLYSSIQRDFPQSFANQHEYYDESDELVEDEELEDEQPIYDPDAELEQRRARLDHKLKNTFEAIFEKYERDFEGIGDEIDLATGDIVVNNGHLVEMMDERDAGLQKVRRISTQEPEDLSTSMGEDESLDDEDNDDDEDDEGEDVDEDEEQDEENEEEETSSSDDMDEDDLILRGFTQANRFIQVSPELGVSKDPYIPPASPRPVPLRRPSPQNTALPSRLDIIAQFGPQLGPQIVDYIQQQERVPSNSHIEPAWRVPELPLAAPQRRPILKSVAPPPELERSPSPEASASVWAVVRPRGRRRRDGRDSDAIFRGETIVPNQNSRPPGRVKYRSVDGLDLLPQPVRRRKVKFTTEDDENMLDWVMKERQRGTHLWSNVMWKGLEAKHPHHAWHSWRCRYRNHFNYLWSNLESDLSTTDTTADDAQILDQDYPKTRIEDVQYPSAGLRAVERPSRIRKPAQRDSRIISWSEAVNAIASLDPDLHAGILDDVRRANNGETSWAFERPAVSATGQMDTLRLSVNRPVSSHRIGQPQRSNFQSHEPSARRFSDNQVSVSKASDGQSSHKKSMSLGSAPCPHADCRQHTTLYRLQRRDHEDVSQMTLHLLRVHNTTPFPCGELNCLRKGERGYFMQRDLVKHVKSAHPYISALQRLRGRVDPTLLDQNGELVHRDFSPSLPPAKSPGSRQRDSDFMSPKRVGHFPSSSEVLSPTPDHDRTVSPSGLERGAGEASTSTPLTSVSSLKVNHSSATTFPRREVSDSQERLDPPFCHEESWQDTQVEENQQMTIIIPTYQMTSSGEVRLSGGGSARVEDEHSAAATNSDNPPAIRKIEVNTRVKSHIQDLDHNDNVSAHTISSTNEPRRRISSGRTSNTQAPQERQGHSSATQYSSPILGSSNSITVPNSQSSLADMPSSSCLPSIQTGSGSNSSRTAEGFCRNAIDPSHEFSDEETGIKPFPKSAPPPIMLPPSTVSFSIANLPITPVTKKKVPKSVVRKALGQEDFDELSLGPDDFSIISSHSRSMPHATFGSHPGIKREGTVGPRLASVAPSRKRKLSDLQGRDEVDELGADELFGKSTGPQSRIKKEVDLDGTPMVHRVKSQRKEAKKAQRGKEPRLEVTRISSQFGSSVKASKNTTGTSTPLLDLTFDRSIDMSGDTREIHDSGEDGSMSPSSSIPARTQSRHPSGAAGTNSSLDGLLTPTRDKRWSGDMARSKGTTIVVKTPGGTYRRCGEGDFRCRRSFCFRCSSAAISVET